MRMALWPESIEHIHVEVEDFFAGQSSHIKQVFLAEASDNTVVGFIELNIRSYVPGSVQTSVPFVEGWYVADEFRGHGVGKELMHAAERWAIDQGFSELGSDAVATNDASIKAHKQLGFEEIEQVVCLLKKLPDGQ